MLDSQPAYLLSDKDETRNVTAVRDLLVRSASPPSSVTEFFGGVGGVTRMARELYPDVPFSSWDMDDYCLKKIAKVPDVLAVKGDSIRDATPDAGGGALMDFNIWTLLRARKQYKACMDRVFAAAPAWVQLADSSWSKLHINWKSYGLADAAPETYLAALGEWAAEYGYELKDSERAHHKTVMVLLTKKPR